MQELVGHILSTPTKNNSTEPYFDHHGNEYCGDDVKHDENDEEFARQPHDINGPPRFPLNNKRSDISNREGGAFWS